MNARQLEIFHAVMRSGTITGAASFLGISQPAVSKAMRAMERNLGFRLLRPIKGRLYPTPEAQRLLPDADRIMSELSAFERLTGEVKTGGAALVRVVASSSSATALLPAAAAAFQKANPAVRISSHLLPARNVAEAVAAGEADFGLTLSPVQLPGLTVRTLGAAEMVFIAPIGHPLLERETITPTRSRLVPADLVRPRDALRPVARPGLRECGHAPADRPAGDHEPRCRLLRPARARRGAGRQLRAQHRSGRPRLAPVHAHRRAAGRR